MNINFVQITALMKFLASLDLTFLHSFLAKGFDYSSDPFDTVVSECEEINFD